MPPDTAQQHFLRAVLVNLLNPGPYIFWSTVTGPIFLEGWRQAASLGLGFLASFYAGLLGGLTMFMIVFAVASHAGPRVRRVLNGVAAVALLCFGLYQLWSGLMG
jgi:threonine/homoserine/homoserine lactone efflux protein